MCKIDSQWEAQGAQLCDDREGWGVGSGREAQEGGAVPIPAADLHCPTAETNTAL